MLSRYSATEMSTIWSDEARYRRWREVELAVLAARVEQGLCPADDYRAASDAPAPTREAVEQAEADVRHDVVAFLEAWTADMSASVAARVHRDLTSSDVVDTAQALAVRDASALIAAVGAELVLMLVDRALELRNVPCVARTHGQAAALDVVGHRLADFAHAVDRALGRIAASAHAAAVVNISGPVGTGVGLPPAVAQHVATQLNLSVPEVTTQVMFRDVTAAWVSDLALLGAVCESIATDIRLGQHDGVGELLEGRGARQEGSSAMPHKKNPITAENITGLARVLRSYVGPMLENVALWQHRDLSHSSVERIVLPDAAALAHTIAVRTAGIISGLVVDERRLKSNIDRAGAELASSRLQSQLMADGVRRGEAAEQVRELLKDEKTAIGVIDSATDEVLNSAELDRVFSRLLALRSRYAPER